MLKSPYLIPIVLVACSFICTAGDAARLFGGYYNEQRINNLRRNCERYDWAKALRKEVIDRAAPWAGLSDEELWKMVPGQDLPRCIDVTWDYDETPHRIGCLKCGEEVFKHGNYPYKPDFRGKPWKLTCPSCGVVFPTNDFGKYYESAIDERGQFNPARGDRTLLFNADHPDPADPLHKFGVDDGFGYVDENGREHKFIGYYTWQYWGEVRTALNRLAQAFLYTGDKVYARKAAVLLDRIADVYPDMDWQPYADRGWFHSDGSSRKGKIDGRIWETGIVTSLVDSYDAILSGTLDNPELFAFLQQKAAEFRLPSPKGTRDLFLQNVDDRLLRCAVQAIWDGRIHGNEGMHQSSMAACAIALDTEPETSQWLDWVFAPGGGGVPGIILGGLDRDGFGGEGAPGYSVIWGGQIGLLAQRLADYGKYSRHDIFRDYPQFQLSYSAPWQLCVLGAATPPIGDSGATGVIGRVACDPGRMAQGFYFTRDPALARAAWCVNGGSTSGIRGSLYQEDPMAIQREIEEIGSRWDCMSGSRNLAGFGLTVLESGTWEDGAGLWCYYGRTTRHGHPDRLNFGLYAFGTDMSPDLGYPEFAADWPHRSEWTNNTISHNTVVVDGQKQPVSLSGKPLMFKSLPGIGAFTIASPGIYAQASEYSRSMLLVDGPGSGHYVLDIFRVTGGSDHLLSFHGPPGPVSSTGLRLTRQVRGTYAGPEVSFGQLGEDVPSGHSFLYNVERDTSPPQRFALDWKAEEGYRDVAGSDDFHLRWHVLGDHSDVALADGDPPQNKPDNPRRIRYALLHREGSPGFASTFCSVLEPYRSKPILRSISALPVTGSKEARGVRVEFVDGTVDVIVVAPEGQLVTGPDGLTLHGGIGLIRLFRGEVLRAALIGGLELRRHDFVLKATGAMTGKVVRMSRGLEPGEIVIESAGVESASDVEGEQIVIENDGVLNACYTIHSARKEGALWRLSLGPVSFVRGFADPSDYSKGYTYNFSEGAAFSIPCHSYWQAPVKR